MNEHQVARNREYVRLTFFFVQLEAEVYRLTAELGGFKSNCCGIDDIDHEKDLSSLSDGDRGASDGSPNFTVLPRIDLPDDADEHRALVQNAHVELQTTVWFTLHFSKRRCGLVLRARQEF